MNIKTSQELTTHVDLDTPILMKNYGSNVLVDFIKVRLSWFDPKDYASEDGGATWLLDIDYKGYAATKAGKRNQRAAYKESAYPEADTLATPLGAALAKIVVDMAQKMGVSLSEIEANGGNSVSLILAAAKAL